MNPNFTETVTVFPARFGHVDIESPAVYRGCFWRREGAANADGNVITPEERFVCRIPFPARAPKGSTVARGAWETIEAAKAGGDDWFVVLSVRHNDAGPLRHLRVEGSRENYAGRA
jgi:hypothetical protein